MSLQSNPFRGFAPNVIKLIIGYVGYHICALREIDRFFYNNIPLKWVRNIARDVYIVTMYASNGVLPINQRTIGHYFVRNNVKVVHTFAISAPVQCLRVFTTPYNHASLIMCFQTWINRLINRPIDRPHASADLIKTYGHIRNSELSLNERIQVVNTKIYDYYANVIDCEMGDYIATDDDCFKMFIPHIKSSVSNDEDTTISKLTPIRKVDYLLWIRIQSIKRKKMYKSIFDILDKIGIRGDAPFPTYCINYEQLQFLNPANISFMLLYIDPVQACVVCENYALVRFKKALIFSHREFDVFMRIDVLIVHASRVHVAAEHLAAIHPFRISIGCYHGNPMITGFYKMDYAIFKRLWPVHDLMQVLKYCRPETIPGETFKTLYTAHTSHELYTPHMMYVPKNMSGEICYCANINNDMSA